MSRVFIRESQIFVKAAEILSESTVSGSCAAIWKSCEGVHADAHFYLELFNKIFNPEPNMVNFYFGPYRSLLLPEHSLDEFQEESYLARSLALLLVAEMLKDKERKGRKNG